MRAGIVAHPALYPWSSYVANAGLAEDPFLTAHAEFVALASDPRPRRNVYRALVEQGVEREVLEAIRAATNGGYPLAAEAFKSSLALPPGRQLERGRAGRRVRQERKQSVPDTDSLF